MLLHELILEVLDRKYLIEFAILASFDSGRLWVWDIVRVTIDHELYCFMADLMHFE